MNVDVIRLLRSVMRFSKPCFQFSTKQLLIGVLCASIVCVGAVRIAEAIDKKRRIDNLKQWVHIKVSHELVSLKDRFIALVLGKQYVCHVEAIGLGSEPSDQSMIDQLSEFSEAKKFTVIYHTCNSDFSPLSKLANVEEVFFEESTYGDISYLSGMGKLKKLTIVEGGIDGGLEAIGSLNELTHVRINLVHIPFTDESFNRFCNATSMEILDLEHNYSFGTLENLEPLTKLRKLKSLSGLLREGNKTHLAIAELMPVNCEIKFETN